LWELSPNHTAYLVYTRNKLINHPEAAFKLVHVIGTMESSKERATKPLAERNLRGKDTNRPCIPRLTCKSI
jgi:hypothetical protein